MSGVLALRCGALRGEAWRGDAQLGGAKRGDAMSCGAVRSAATSSAEAGWGEGDKGLSRQLTVVGPIDFDHLETPIRAALLGAEPA